MKVIRWILRFLPSLLTALVLAIIVWVSAVTSTDPNEDITLDKPVPITVLGLDPDMVITSETVEAVTVTVRAPQSIHSRIASDPSLVKASVNLSGLSAGTHSLTLQVNIAIDPTELIAVVPETLEYSLENMLTRQMPISLRETGALPISYEGGEATLDSDNVEVIGPESQVQKVAQVVATIDLTNVTSSITKNVDLKALDSRGVTVTGINLNPTQVQVELPVKQLGGYRNVFIKIVTTGQIARGFYLTSILAEPPNITIYSNDPEIAKNMPAFIETVPINLNGLEQSIETNVALNLPEGIVVIGEQNVNVEVGIAAIQSSLQLVEVPITVLNLAQGLKATLSPDKVDIYLSGPLYLLDQITTGTIEVTLDLTDKTAGTYQLTPTVQLDDPSIQLDSMLPASIEVVLAR